MDFDLILLYLIIYGIPVAVLIWFIYSIVKFVKRDKSDKRYCRMCIISLCISGLLLITIIAFYLFVIWLLTNMVRNM